jgi:hypothetical protein
LAAWVALLLGTGIVVFMLTFMLGGLAGWNIYLVMKNQTALENYDLDVARHLYRFSKSMPMATFEYI